MLIKLLVINVKINNLINLNKRLFVLNRDDKKKRIINNMLSLMFLQGVNYIVPLFIFPILVKRLGVEGFGLYSLVLSVVAFFRLIVEFGFDLTGTKYISVNRDFFCKINFKYSSIMFAKLYLVMLCFALLCICVFLFEKITIHYMLFFIAYIVVIGDSLFPVWFFQGIERMQVITYSRCLYKIISSVLIVIFVNELTDLPHLLLIDGVCSVILGVGVQLYIFKYHGIRLVMVPINTIKAEVKESSNIFISRISVVIYMTLNTFLLGIMTNNSTVGAYAIAEKIYVSLRGLTTPIIQAVFPYLSHSYERDYIKFKLNASAISYFVIIGLFVFSLILSGYSQDILKIVSGEQSEQVVDIINVFSIALIFSVGGFFSTILVIQSKEKILASITFITLIVNVTLVVPAIYWYGAIGVAYVVLISQVVHALLQIYCNHEIISFGLKCFCEKNNKLY